MNPTARSTHDARQRLAVLEDRQRQQRLLQSRLETRARGLDDRLEVVPATRKALEELSDGVLADTRALLEEKVSFALQEVLQQPLYLKVRQQEDARSALGISLTFSIVRDGQEQDIRLGCGGSVSNVLATTLRMFALAVLDSEKHRPFLVLDEQDCFLSSAVVPRLMRVIKLAAEELSLQVIVISHHDASLLEEHVDRVFHFVEGVAGVEVFMRDQEK